MGKFWETEVLTTCALDYMEWRNHYPEGTENIDGTTVRRFRVDAPRDVGSFNKLSADLNARQSNATLAEQENWMWAQGPVSTALLEYLHSQRNDYDAFIFYGYLYATTYFGLPAVRDKAFLTPLAHDEWTIYFTMWDEFFTLPRALIFNTPAEREFLRRRFPHAKLNGEVIGVGIEPPASADPVRFRARYNLSDAFLLYLGRIDASKGCDQMIDYYIRARQAGAIKPKLVLAGKEVMPVPFHDAVVGLGFVDEQEKWNAIAACDWLWMPSPHESLSMVLLEAWAMARPVVVNAKCDVLRAQCERSNGGLWYENEAEWLKIITLIDAPTQRGLGVQGQAFVDCHYSWPRVESQYRRLIESRANLCSTSPANGRSAPPPALGAPGLINGQKG